MQIPRAHILCKTEAQAVASLETKLKRKYRQQTFFTADVLTHDTKLAPFLLDFPAIIHACSLAHSKKIVIITTII